MCNEINVAVSGVKHLPRNSWYKRKLHLVWQYQVLVMTFSLRTVLWPTVTPLVPYYGAGRWQLVDTGISYTGLILPSPLSKLNPTSRDWLEMAVNSVPSSTWSAVILQHILYLFFHTVVCLMQIPEHYRSSFGQLKIKLCLKTEAPGNSLILSVISQICIYDTLKQQ